MVLLHRFLNLNTYNFVTIGIYRCLSLGIKFHWFQRCHVCMFWFDWVPCDSKKKVCILIQTLSPFPLKPGSLPPAWGSCCPHSAHRRQATVGSNLPPTPFKEAVSISLRVVTFCIPGLRLHPTSSPTKPQSHLLYLTSLSLTLFPWRWWSIEFLPTKVRLVARCCSLGRDLDAVHGQGESERGGGCTERERGASERLCDYITVIMQRLNRRAASFGVCGEIAFVYKGAEITSSLCWEKSGRLTHLQREQEGGRIESLAGSYKAKGKLHDKKISMYVER